MMSKMPHYAGISLAAAITACETPSQAATRRADRRKKRDSRTACAEDAACISYTSSMASWFIYDGEAFSIECCHSSALLQYLYACIDKADPGRKQRGGCAPNRFAQARKALRDLGPTLDSLARFYAIESVMSFSIPVPLHTRFDAVAQTKQKQAS